MMVVHYLDLIHYRKAIFDQLGPVPVELSRDNCTNRICDTKQLYSKFDSQIKW